MAEKIPECDREAARLLALQTKKSTAGRALDTLLCTLFVGALACGALLHLILPDRAASETENRTLTQAPALTWSAVLDGSYTADFADYLADQFPARDLFITLKAASERALGKKQNNGVIFAAGNTLVTRDDAPDLENLHDNLRALDVFSTYCAEKNIPSTAAITGRTADVLDSTLPAYYGSVYSDRLWDSFAMETADVSFDVLNLRDPLRERATAGEYVYYRTDHHWTTLGAYYGYAEILRSWGGTPAALSDFTRETVSDAFYGTTWSTAGASWVAPDVMEYFRYDGDEGFTTSILDDGTSFSGLYDVSYLAGKDKYSSFLSSNHALVTVTQDDPSEERETLLIIKDSFAHAAAPFFARDYDLVIVDMRYYKMSVAALLDTYQVDRVLTLMNIDSLTASSVLRLLTVGAQ